MKRYGVNHRFSTSYHPQTSGQVENTNRALKRILEKTIKNNPAIWSRKLDDALWDFRTAYKTPTETTPYKLLYGKNCHLPFEIEHRAYWVLKNCNPDLIAIGEKIMFQLHELDKLRHQAYENSRLYKARTKVWHDRKLKMRKEFKRGNKVLLFHSKYKFKQSKLRSRWLGPYVVKHQYSSGYVELYGKDGKKIIVNGHRLKIYHEEEDYNYQREAVTPFFPKNDSRSSLEECPSSKRSKYKCLYALEAKLEEKKLNFKRPENMKNGTKDPIFGMLIPAIMLNDNIKASAEYSEYLAKSKVSAPVKATSRGKCLITKDGVEVAVERVSIPKRRRSKTVVKEVGPTGIVIGGEGHRESDEEEFDQLKKLKGLETLSKAIQFKVTSEVTDELTLKSSNKGAGVILEVPDEPSDYSNSSSFDSEFAVKDILSDEDEVTEKADDVKKADVKKDTNEQVAEEHVADKQTGDKEHGDNHGDNEPTGDAQADVQMSETQLEKPEATKVISTLTLSSSEFTSQFLNDTPE
ncbi:reverse transcriptase domain-containing protein [Tanacetum coccineum]